MPLLLRAVNPRAPPPRAGALGRLGAWALGRLGAWALGRLGAWALGRLGAWALGERRDPQNHGIFFGRLGGIVVTVSGSYHQKLGLFPLNPPLLKRGELIMVEQ